MAGNYHRLWHSDDIIMLVAWLEFCIKNSLDFMKSIASLSNGLYTAKQAKDKLIDLARHTYGTGCYVKGQVVLEKGMKSFSKLPANVKKDVDAAVVSFRAQYAHLLNEKAFDGHGATRPQQGQENTLTRLTGSRSLECVQENWGGKNQALQKEVITPSICCSCSLVSNISNRAQHPSSKTNYIAVTQPPKNIRGSLLLRPATSFRTESI